MTKNDRNPAGQKIAELILQNYDIKSAKDIQDAVKDAFAPLFESMLNAEMTTHLGYEKSDQNKKEHEDRRNGYSTKTIKTSVGESQIKVPRDRDGTFEPIIIPKHQRDVSGIEAKVLAMYARGMSQRDIAKTIEEIYGFSISHDKISTITDCIMDEVQEWQNRPLKPIYPFVFVDCIYVSMREGTAQATQHAVYVVLGVDINGHKDILGLWVDPTESKSSWMNIFDSMKSRGVQDILFMCMDGVSGLEDGVKSIFPEAVVQRCLVHLMRNSIKYVPSKDYKEFCTSVKAFYQACDINECRHKFEEFKAKWSDKYPGAVKVWANHFNHIEQLFDYPSAIRKVIYTTNAIESVNSSLRKVTKKGSFENEKSLFKIFYLRIKELYEKWNDRPIANWAMVRNQLEMYDNLSERLAKYSTY